MALQFSTVTRKGPITIVTLARPDVYNALHTDAHYELEGVFDDFAADPEQWVAIITGAGDKAFCAGANFGEPAPQGAATSGDPADSLGEIGHLYIEAVRIFRARKPIVAAVAGFVGLAAAARIGHHVRVATRGEIGRIAGLGRARHQEDRRERGCHRPKHHRRLLRALRRTHLRRHPAPPWSPALPSFVLRIGSRGA